MGAPTRFQNGVTNNSGYDALGMLGELDPTLYHTFWEDFDYYAAANWIITNVGVTPTVALSGANGGAILQCIKAWMSVNAPY